MIVPTLKAGSAMWRWYSALFLANASDLLFTYTAVERGFQEWNPVLRPVLLTPWPAVTKLAVLCVLGYGLWSMVRQSHATGRALALLRGATLVYLLVIVFHVLALFMFAA
jgi:hypothetical protein